MIFVFGSNLQGKHGKGAAKTALEKYGAKYGQGVGLQGNSYAIPTKDHFIKTLPLEEIEPYVKDFLSFAKENPNKIFYLTPIGCGLAGHDPQKIADIFFRNDILSIKNIVLSCSWVEHFARKK